MTRAEAVAAVLPGEWVTSRAVAERAGSTVDAAVHPLSDGVAAGLLVRRHAYKARREYWEYALPETAQAEQRRGVL